LHFKRIGKSTLSILVTASGIRKAAHYALQEFSWHLQQELTPFSEAPITVKNFIELAEGKREWTHPTTHAKSTDKLFDGTIFHRVIPDFMIQGGDPTGTGMGGPGYRFQDETKGSAHKFDKAGKLAMANSGPGTNGCQFFITVAATPWLTGNHTIFGEVVEGQDIVTKISLVPRGGQDKPKKPVVLESVVIERVA